MWLMSSKQSAERTRVRASVLSLCAYTEKKKQSKGRRNLRAQAWKSAKFSSLIIHDEDLSQNASAPGHIIV